MRDYWRRIASLARMAATGKTMSTSDDESALRFTMGVSAGLRIVNGAFFVLSILAILGLIIGIVSVVQHAMEPRSEGIGDPWWVDAIGAAVMLVVAVLIALVARLFRRNARTASVVHEFQEGVVIRTLLDSKDAPVRRDEFSIDRITSVNTKYMKYGRHGVILKRGTWANPLLLAVADEEAARQIATRAEAARQAVS